MSAKPKTEYKAPEPQPSATVVVLRDAPDSLEFLLLQRVNRNGRPGVWIFPGGRVEETDRAGDPMATLRQTAVRETHEESGLEIRADELSFISRWITPAMVERRFDTAFFVTRVPATAVVRVDGEEIGHHRWLTPQRAIDLFREGEVRLAPPTFVTIHWLLGFEAAEEAMAHLAGGPVITFRPHVVRVADGVCMLYPGDAGYASDDPDRPGSRHRLWSRDRDLRYERSPT